MRGRILMVEDDAILRKIYAAKFALEGYLVETANDGRAALAGIKRAKDLGVVDYLVKSQHTPSHIVAKARAYQQG